MPSDGDAEAADDPEPATGESAIPDPREFLSSPIQDEEADDDEADDGEADDSEADGPRIPGSEDAPRSVRLSFWWLVLVCNGVVLALFLGVMYGVVEGNWDLGGRLLAAGGILAVYAYYKYRTFPREALEGDGESDADGVETGNTASDAETESTADEGEGEGKDGSGEAGSDETGDGTPGEFPEPAGEPAPDEPVQAPAGTVEDERGRQYLLVKRSGESSLVRDPATGEQSYVPNDRLEAVGESPLEAAAGSVPESTRRVLSATHDDRSLGLLVEVVDRGPVAVRSLLSEYDLCESDLHGLFAEFRAAGLVAETTVAGERGYEPTEVAAEGVAHLRTTGRA